MNTIYHEDDARPRGLARYESSLPLVSPALYVKLRQLIGGAKTFIVPPLEQPSTRAPAARYGYTVWLRHLAVAALHGMETPPGAVVELGPGKSIASGLSALLAGAHTYIGHETEPRFDPARELAVLDEVIELFRSRARLFEPELTEVRPRLESYDFPVAALGGTERLEQNLRPERLQAIRDALRGARSTAAPTGPIRIQYVSEWQALVSALVGLQADMIFSQAVMEYWDRPGDAYQQFQRWLRPGGWMSHQIDLSAHETSCIWSGHWSYSDLVWRVIRGRKPFFLNREPLSGHLEQVRAVGLDPVAAILTVDSTGLGRDELHSRFRHLSDEDLSTRSAFLLARKPEPST